MVTEVESENQKKPLIENDSEFKAKRTIILDTMNDLFGQQNFFNHLNFFNENSNLSQEQIITKYIQKISQ